MRNVFKRSLIALAVLIVVSACSLKSTGVAALNGNGGGGSGSGGGPTPTPLQNTAVIEAMGVLSSTQVLPALGAMTGVSNYRGIAAIMTAYDKYNPAMTGSGDALSFNSAMSGAYVELVARFCQAAMTQEALLPVGDVKRLLFKGINLGTGATPDTVRASKGALATQLSKRFWQRSPTVAQQQIIEELIQNLVVTTQDVTGARNLAVAACGAVGASYQTFVQ